MLEEIALPTSGAWEPALLAPIFEINERMLERLHQAARACGVSDTAATVTTATTAATAVTAAMPRMRAAPALVAALLGEWCALDAPAQRRLGQCPYLLLDAGFGEPERWPPPGTLAVHDAAVSLARASQHYLCDEGWRALVRRALLLGWHLARANPLSARVLLGMTPVTAERLAGMDLGQLDELADHRAGWAAPRWQSQPQIWRQLLRAVHAPQRQLHWTQLRGLQLLAATTVATEATRSAGG